MDEIDIKILRELVNDARLSYNEIARRISIAVATVAARISNLEKQGVIKGYSALVDAEKLGYDVVAVIEVTVSGGKITEVEEEVAKNLNVYAVYDVTGPCDIVLITRFKSRRELSKFVKSLLALKFVERTITHVVLATIKEDPKVPL